MNYFKIYLKAVISFICFCLVFKYLLFAYIILSLGSALASYLIFRRIEILIKKRRGIYS